MKKTKNNKLIKTMKIFLEVTDSKEMPKVYGEYSRDATRMYGKYKEFKVIVNDCN